MKQHIEMIVKTKQIKEIQTKGGKWLYSFSIPISKMVGEEQLTEWLQVAILQDQQRPDLHNAKEVHFIGELTLKQAYGNYPQGVSIFGFFIDPILNQVYRQRKVRKNIAPEPIQASNAVQDVPQQTQNGYSDPVAAANPQDPYIPM